MLAAVRFLQNPGTSGVSVWAWIYPTHNDSRRMKLCLESLPEGQKAIWAAFADSDMSAMTLYGGTALALRYGHRESVDFDFFSQQPITPSIVSERLPWLNQHLDSVFQNSRNTYVVLSRAPGMNVGDEVKLSFFGELSIPILEEPEVAANGVKIASVRDLLATKLKVLHDRVEGKDYIDIAEILKRSDDPTLTLQQGLSDIESMYEGANAAITLKELCWFNQEELKSLSTEVKELLVTVVKAVADLPPIDNSRPNQLRRREDGGLDRGV